MIGEDFNRAAPSGGMNLSIWFPQQDQVSVFLESSIADPDEERFYESALFALYAARQIANLGGGAFGVSLAKLMALDAVQPLRDLEEALKVQIVPTRIRGGQKGFTAELRPAKRAFFKLHPHGFGMLGKGVAYYAPTSTFALLCWLLRRREGDATYQRALAATAHRVGTAGVSGWITVASQSNVAMQAVGAAWSEAIEASNDDESEAADDFELSAEAVQACEANGIDFAALLSWAGSRLSETAAQIPGEGYVALPDAISERICRLATLGAAELDKQEGEKIARSFAAIETAEATEDEGLIEAAYAHQDSALAELIAENELEPVVQALAGALFTTDPERAAPGQA